jgi:hypothetical protein
MPKTFAILQTLLSFIFANYKSCPIKKTIFISREEETLKKKHFFHLQLEANTLDAESITGWHTETCPPRSASNAVWRTETSARRPASTADQRTETCAPRPASTADLPPLPPQYGPYWRTETCAPRPASYADWRTETCPPSPASYEYADWFAETCPPSPASTADWGTETCPPIPAITADWHAETCPPRPASYADQRTETCQCPPIPANTADWLAETIPPRPASTADQPTETCPPRPLSPTELRAKQACERRQGELLTFGRSPVAILCRNCDHYVFTEVEVSISDCCSWFLVLLPFSLPCFCCYLYYFLRKHKCPKCKYKLTKLGWYWYT